MEDQKRFLRMAHSLIIQGRGESVKDKLKVLQKQGTTIDDPVAMANLARRVGMYHFAASMLYPIVRSETSEASEKAKAEYAAALSRIGNYKEAEELFSSISNSIVKDYSSEYVDVLFKSWNNKKASELLELSVEAIEDPYRKVVAMLNLASAYIGNQDFKKAEGLLEELDEISLINNYGLIMANTREMMGQIQFYSQKYGKAHQYFKEAEEMLKNSNSRTWIFAKKWLVIARFALGKPLNETTAEMNEVRTLARQFNHWETLRDCDLYQAIFTKDRDLFQRVYYSTPHEAYRQRALQFWTEEPPADTIVHFGKKTSKDTPLLDLETGMINGKIDFIKPGEMAHKLTVSLFKDFYSPISVYEIFQDCYEGEYFHPETSKDRVYKSIRKLKNIIEPTDYGLEVTNNKAFGYRLRTRKPLKVKYIESGLAVDKSNHHLALIRDHFNTIPFTRKELQNHLKVSDRSANRLITDLVDSGELQKIGSGPKTSYKLVS